MARSRLITPSRKLTVHIPEDIAARAELYLTSPALGKVPFGAWAKFVTQLIQEFFEHQDTPHDDDDIHHHG